jgi:serine/threonine protein kinase
MAAGEAGLKDGRYVLVRKLGDGAQGTTFEAVDGREGKLVAIKRFDVKGAAKWKDVELAEREARVLASVSHPMLPTYIDHFEEGGSLYLVMEKIEGESLAALRKRGARFGEKEAIRLLRDASEALEYLHGASPAIVHRDLKPGNVIRKPDGSHAFVDFGAVRDRLKAEGGSTVVGTFGFMAPEQFQGRAQPSSDVYGIGATVIAMLSGIDPEDLPHKGLRIDVPAALKGKASDALIATLTAMTDPDPDTRPSKIPELGEAVSVKRAPVAEDPIPTLGPWLERLPQMAQALWRFVPVLWVLVGLAWWLAPHALARDFLIGMVFLTVLGRIGKRGAERRDRRSRMRHQERVRVHPRAPAVRIDTQTREELEEEERDEARRRL